MHSAGVSCGRDHVTRTALAADATSGGVDTDADFNAGTLHTLYERLLRVSGRVGSERSWDAHPPSLNRPFTATRAQLLACPHVGPRVPHPTPPPRHPTSPTHPPPHVHTREHTIFCPGPSRSSPCVAVTAAPTSSPPHPAPPPPRLQFILDDLQAEEEASAQEKRWAALLRCAAACQAGRCWAWL